MMRMPSKRTAVSYLDPSYNDEEPHASDSEEGYSLPYSPYGNGAADADDEGEGVVQYAQKATFRRPVVVQCSVGQPKLPMKEVLKTGPPQLGSWLELDRGVSPVRIEGDRPSEGEFDADAEERLERRLAEDKAKEQEKGDSSPDDGNGEGEAEIPWSDVVYDESIVDEHLKRRHEEEEADEERPGSAMSELDLLVRDSLLIAHDSLLIRSGERLGGRKRKVSFEKALDVETAGHKRVASMGPSTPYPFNVEEDDDEPYGFKVNVKAALERWEMNEFGGTPSPMDAEKALKVLGLMEADESIGLD